MWNDGRERDLSADEEARSVLPERAVRELADSDVQPLPEVRRATEVPGFQHLARSESQQEAGCGEYTQTNVCPSDIAIREEDVTEDEKKIIQLICGREWAR